MHHRGNFGSVRSCCFSCQTHHRWKVKKERNLLIVCEVKTLRADPDRKRRFHVCCSCPSFLCSFELANGERHAFHAGLRQTEPPCECAILVTWGMKFSADLCSVVVGALADGFARMPRQEDADFFFFKA